MRNSRGCSSSWRWGLLFSNRQMVAATSKNNEAGKLIEVSLSEDDRQKYERRSQQVEGKSGKTEEVEGTKE